MVTSSRPSTSEEISEKYGDRHVVPVLVLEFNDERTRSRWREATQLSIIFHLLLIIALWLSPKYMAGKAVKVWTADELIRQRELTYLNLPPDRQKVSRRPESDIISDKDRIAVSRRPTLDRKALKELIDSSRPGSPNPPGALAQQPPNPPALAQASPASEQGAPQQVPAPKPPDNSSQLARLEPLPKPIQRGAFNTSRSAGSAIEQAARAAAANRVAPGGGGTAGDYGAGITPGGATQKSDLEITTDTMGVDFGPYLARVLHDVRGNWYNLIPEAAYPPLRKRGKVAIQFAILKDGSVAGMTLFGPSGDVALDRAAWGGITASNPFPPLPEAFKGPYLGLRFNFYYNPDANDLR